ncbi:MAG: hypothetical protein H7A32_02475 [Deltaproteobacteria bacterium]|nr:hypothetical protein [Deltaproteobacteria bacterium]
MNENKISLLSCANLQPGEHISPLEKDLKAYLADPESDSLRICAAGELQKASNPEVDLYQLKDAQSLAYDQLTECPTNATASSVLSRTSSLSIKRPDAEKAHVEEYQFSFSLNAESLQLLYNQGFFFQSALGPNLLSSPQNICKISEEGGEEAGQIWVSDQVEERMLDSIDPKNRAVDLPKSYPGFSDSNVGNIKIQKETERVALTIPDGQKERQAFWSHYHSLQDLHSKDAALLRELLGNTQNQSQNHPWLEPFGDLGPDNRRDYVISTTALHYYGAYLIQELRRIGDGVYGEVENNKTAHALVSRLEVMLAEQSDPKSRKVARPVSLDLKALEPALIKVFGDKDILAKIEAIDLDEHVGENGKAVWAQPLASFGPKEMPWYVFTNDYIDWQGSVSGDEIRLFYAIEVFKEGLTHAPAYTWFDLVGIPHGTSSDDHFICENLITEKNAEDKGNFNEDKEGRSCMRRRYQAWQGEIALLKKLAEESEDPAAKVRLQELIAVDEALENIVLADSNANSFKHSWWAALAFVGLGYFAHRGQKVAVIGERPQLPESDKSDDDSGVGGEGDSSGEDPVVVPENPSGDAAEYSAQPGRFRFDLMPQLTVQDAQRWGLYAFAAGGGYAAWKLSKTGAKKLGFAAAAAVGTIEFIEAGFDLSKLDPLGSSPAMASEAKSLNTQAQDGDWLVDENLCVKEYHQQESGRVSKFNTGVCGLDEIEAYATERGDAAGVQFARSAQGELDAFVEEIADSIKIERAEYSN